MSNVNAHNAQEVIARTVVHLSGSLGGTRQQVEQAVFEAQQFFDINKDIGNLIHYIADYDAKHKSARPAWLDVPETPSIEQLNETDDAFVILGLMCAFAQYAIRIKRHGIYAFDEEDAKQRDKVLKDVIDFLFNATKPRWDYIVMEYFDEQD